MTTPRRSLLPLLAGLAGCSVLPDRPYQATTRFALAPEPPRRGPPGLRRPVLLVRSLRAAPGLEIRGLRSIGVDGVVTSDPWSEWAAPPVELAEEALRRWLTASGRFSAVTAPGSRLRADYVLEGELFRLETVPTAQTARAGYSLLLLGQAGGEQDQLLGTIIAEGSAPLAPGSGPTGQAEAMRAALAAALAEAERGVMAAIGR
jgi:cholesterol transport system auxiliary component